MKRSSVLTIFIWAMLMSAAHAQTAGDTVLHIVAQGKVTTAADRIIILVPVQKNAPTATEARAATQMAVDRFKAALVAAGISPNAITMKQAGGMGFIGNETYGDGAEGTALSMMAAVAKRSATALLELQLGNRAQLDKVIAILDDQNLVMTGGPRSVLLNDTSARQAAIADAVRNARREAEDYARALGLSVKRVNRISNDCANPQQDYRQMFTQWATIMGGADTMTVETVAQACVDVVAGP